MRAVMSRSLAVYQGRNAGRLPRQVVIHKTQAFRDEEMDGCIDAWGRTEDIECVQVVTSNDWRAVRLLGARTKDARSTPDSWRARRSFPSLTAASCSSSTRTRHRWLSPRAAHVQGGQGIPRPITLVRHTGAGPLERLGEDALALSKMDWNNDALFDSLPVTIRPPKRLSQTIAHATSLPAGDLPLPLVHVRRRAGMLPIATKRSFPSEPRKLAYPFVPAALWPLTA